DPLDAQHAVLGEVGVEAAAAAEVAGVPRQLADDEALDLRPARLAVLGVDAVVADERVSHRDDLALVGGVGGHLLVAGDAGVKHDFAGPLAGRPERPAGVDRPVLQRQLCRGSAHHPPYRAQGRAACGRAGRIPGAAPAAWPNPVQYTGPGR